MDYSFDYTAPNTSEAAATAAVVGFVLLFFLIFAIAAYAIGAFLMGRLFKKAGVPQWAAWVPIYNTWKMLEIGGQQGFWAVLMLFPILNVVSLIFLYIAMFHIGKKLGKEDWFVLVAIFLPVVWMIWLAFDDSKWPTKKAVATETSVKKKTVAKKKTPTKKKA
jgi:hypothetical protein